MKMCSFIKQIAPFTNKTVMLALRMLLAAKSATDTLLQFSQFGIMNSKTGTQWQFVLKMKSALL